MRRIWAHIIIAITTFVMMVATFAAVTNNLNVGMDYANGKTLTFQVTEKVGLDENEYEINDFVEGSLTNVAETMKKRLKAAELTNYDVATFGDNLIKVTLYQDQVDYTQIKEYLSFDGSLYLYSYDSDKMDHYVSSRIFIDPENPAVLEETDGGQIDYPTINIPVDIEDSEYQDVVMGAVKSEGIETKAESEEGAGDAEYTKFMYLLYGFVPGRDSFESENFQNNVLLKFAVKDESGEDNTKIFDYYVKDDVYSLSTVLNINNTDGEIDAASVKTAWKNGTFYVNLLNAGSYGFDVTCINEEVAPATVENAYALGKNQTVFESSTFIAFACAIILVSLILVVFYKLGALSVAITSLASVFCGILFLMLFGAEFNMFAVIGLILVGFASLASGCVYLNKLKDEAYRGRSIKKANTEASKKSTLVVTDINFALILLGAFNYLIAGIEMHSFALVTVLAGAVSLILNLTVFKGFMWLDTNASAAQGKYSLFGIDQTKVPSLVNEEKQSYFGAYADKDFTKKSKLGTIISGIAFVATLAAMITFGVVKGSVYNNPEKSYQDEIFFKIDNDSDLNLANISSRIQTIFENSTDASGVALLEKYDADGNVTSGYVTSPELVDFDILEYDNDKESPYYMHCYAGYIVKVNKQLPTNIKYNNGTQTVDIATDKLFSFEGDPDKNAVKAISEENVLDIQYMKGTSVVDAQPNVVRIIIATGAALLTTALYLLLRYRLSRGLGSLITTLAGTTIAAGLLSLLYFVPAGNSAIIGAVVGEFICFVFAILFMDKEKELVLDDRKHDNSYENRNEIMKKAVSYGFGDILTIAIIGLYLGINFFGFGPNAMAWISLEIILAVAVAFCLAMFILGPVSQFFFKKFQKVGKAKPSKKAKPRTVAQNKSAEPEEAIFIGIND